MQGYYEREHSGKGLEVPTGRLHINVTNLPEFQKLIDKAKREADQLQATVNQLSNFNLSIDFTVDEAIISRSLNQHPQ